MANLNLSEFTEKTFVADTDWTFVWDTAGLISKKVSRNNWLNSGTLAGASAPITVSQTWNDAAVAFTALKVNAVSTASATGSLLLDLQVGGVSQFSVLKNGGLTALGPAILGSLTVGSGILLSVSGGQIRASNGNAINLGASDSTSTDNFANLFLRSSALISFGGNTKLLRDDADNTLALRNGAAAQTFRVYNTFPGTGNNEFGSLNWVDLANEFQITTGQAGTGTSRALCLRSAGGINFRIGGAPGTLVWQFGTSTGHLLAATDNSVDIGASGANRPRNVYVADNLHASVLRAGIWVLNPSGVVHGTIRSESDGVLRLTDSAINNFNRLQFGNTTSSFPALKRVGTELQVVIASTAAAMNVAAGDADMTFIEDRFRRKGAGSPEGAVTAPIGAVYHRTDGGAGTSFYVKESGTGNTGWVGK